MYIVYSVWSERNELQHIQTELPEHVCGFLDNYLLSRGTNELHVLPLLTPVNNDHPIQDIHISTWERYVEVCILTGNTFVPPRIHCHNKNSVTESESKTSNMLEIVLQYPQIQT